MRLSGTPGRPTHVVVLNAVYGKGRYRMGLHRPVLKLKALGPLSLVLNMLSSVETDCIIHWTYY